MMPALATVIREGVGTEIAVAAVVVGDVVSLKAGDAVTTIPKINRFHILKAKAGNNINLLCYTDDSFVF
jgi:hypothetical protein